MELRRRRHKPWCGEHYGQNRDRRLLILGESHHVEHDGENNEGLTCDVVTSYLDGRADPGTRGYYGFFTKLHNIISGTRGWVGEDQRRQSWNSVAFANYIQEALGPDYRGEWRLLTDNQRDDAREAFKETLDELRPTHILVAGKALWSHFAPQHATEPPHPEGYVKVSCGGEPTGFALAMGITHPMGGLS